MVVEKLIVISLLLLILFQVNCRKSYGSQSLNEMRYTFGSRFSSRIPASRAGRASVGSRKGIDLHLLMKSKAGRSFHCDLDDSLQFEESLANYVAHEIAYHCILL